MIALHVVLSSVHRHCWMGDRKGIRPVKTEYWHVGGGELSWTLHVLSLTITISIVFWCSESKTGSTFWYCADLFRLSWKLAIVHCCCYPHSVVVLHYVAYACETVWWGGWTVNHSTPKILLLPITGMMGYLAKFRSSMSNCARSEDMWTNRHPKIHSTCI